MKKIFCLFGYMVPLPKQSNVSFPEELKFNKSLSFWWCKGINYFSFCK